MSQLTNSATNTITTVLGVITTTANTIDRTVSTIDCVTAVMQTKAKAWALVTNTATEQRAKASLVLVTTEIQQEVASRLKQHAKFASEDDNAKWLEAAQALLA